MNKNGELWFDDQGKPIQAHGGMILEHEGVWYWYGEHKGADNCPGTSRVDVIGVSCYSSQNLEDWNYEGLALDVKKNQLPDSLFRPENICERPKVIYNRETGKFVMWFHLDTPGYSYAGVGIAVADQPRGPFTLIKEMRPNRQDCRDMTLFVDQDQKAYLIHSSNWNKTLDISRLTEDYLDVDGFYVSVMIDQEREAPAIILEQDMYYMVTSGCTGWNYNSALYAASPYLLGKWKLIDNPCEGEGYRETFKGQSTYLFRAGEQIYLMLDHWKPDNLQESGYSILPVTIENGKMTVHWTDYFSNSQTFPI